MHLALLLARRLFAGRLFARLTCCLLIFELRLFPFETFLRTGLDFLFGARNRRQSLFAAFELFRNIHLLRPRTLIGRFGKTQQFLDFLRELRL